jgi:hypothetical protein
MELSVVDRLVSRLSKENSIEENTEIFKELHLQTLKDDSIGSYFVQHKVHLKILSFCEEVITSILEEIESLSFVSIKLDYSIIIQNCKVIGKALSILCNAAVSGNDLNTNCVNQYSQTISVPNL